MAKTSSGRGSGTGNRTPKSAANTSGDAAENTLDKTTAADQTAPTTTTKGTTAAKPAGSTAAGLTKPAPATKPPGRKAAPGPAGRATGKPAASKPAGKSAPRARGRKPPPVVTAKPKPWGWIATAMAVVVFAVAAIGYAVLQANEKAELADPNNIEGLQTQSFASQQHSAAPVDYAESPPFGGVHDTVWADCMGTVYPIQIRNENAVHSLEHGAVWITYNPDIPDADLEKLASLVMGQSFIMMSPYPGLESPISLQAWGNQLFVDSADDPRIENFITALRLNPTSTPEAGASCDNPDFAQNPIPEEPPGAPGSSAPATTDPGATTDPSATTDPGATTAP